VTATVTLSADHRAFQEWEMINNIIPAMEDGYLVRYTLDYIEDCEEEPTSKALVAEVKRRGLNLC